MTRVDVALDFDGARVDRVVKDGTGLAMAVVKRLCDEGRVRRVSGARLAAGDRVVAGDAIDVDERPWLVAVDAPLTVLWTDNDVVIVDKPAGLPCHPLDPGEADSVVHRLLARFPGIAVASPEPREGGLVHRLDTDTSGGLAIARHRAAWHALRDAFDAVDKTYLALVAGDARALDGVVVADGIAHDRTDRRRMIVDDAGQPCTTVVAVVGVGHGLPGVVSLVRLGLRGGRRHQLRVHLAARGHPIVGDTLYGGPGPGRTLLHAWRLTLPGRTAVTAPLPDDLRAALAGAGIVAVGDV